jgi:hypothetical protein
VEKIAAIATNTVNPDCRVRLTLGLRERPTGEPLLAHGPGYACRVEPLDAFAGSYQPANWESGVLSGIGYAVRRWLPAAQGLRIDELTGRLTSDGIEGIALAAAAAVAALLSRDPPGDSSPAWVVHISPAPGNGQNGVPRSAEAERQGA